MYIIILLLWRIIALCFPTFASPASQEKLRERIIRHIILVIEKFFSLHLEIISLIVLILFIISVKLINWGPVLWYFLPYPLHHLLTSMLFISN